MRAVISVLGKDRVGIICAVANVLADANVNILDISQTILQGMFTMMMIVDVAQSKLEFAVLSKKLEETGNELGVTIKIQHEDIFNSMHRI
ncbi:MAG: ACT domain-containing protein [Ruminococcaceae bacterium]|nr:ACT domain-containing protein [Oscillospiraceae bacterium]